MSKYQITKDLYDRRMVEAKDPPEALEDEGPDPPEAET